MTAIVPSTNIANGAKGRRIAVARVGTDAYRETEIACAPPALKENRMRRSLLLGLALLAPLIVLSPAPAKALPAAPLLDAPRSANIVEVDRRCGPHGRYVRGHRARNGRWIRGHCVRRRR
jgi:hypothetical protein